MYDLIVREFRGSYSAEHGVGPHNQRWYWRYSEQAVRDWACILHGHFDPAGHFGNVRLD
ncbi:FAD-linked oxidase C-terminal domain-containing protein [Variovorax sp. NFACC26]|uniref:FAD-linked oxidase C-terminal domain-containing protein n=1 Tax=Variovorax sp. NFACC26 TaxID=1566275 RepID=UPI00115FDA93